MWSRALRERILSTCWHVPGLGRARNRVTGRVRQIGQQVVLGTKPQVAERPRKKSGLWRSKPKNSGGNHASVDPVFSKSDSQLMSFANSPRALTHGLSGNQFHTRRRR